MPKGFHFTLLFMCFWLLWSSTSLAGEAGFTGSGSCRECHEKFYKLWEPSHHGKAMQPYTELLAQESLSPQKDDVIIGPFRYRAEITPGTGWVLEKSTDGEKKYPIQHVLGGKNVYYFLTPSDRGRLQTLPVAYDVRKREWFDTAGSGVRHFTDEPVDWRDSVYTFNTSCYSCHVSQLSTNYDLKTDTYETTWSEPGINCETCHGPAEKHIRVCKEAPEGRIPEDLKIKRGGRKFTVEQNNASCSSCHAKMVPLTSSFKPGDRFFDHYDLAVLENTDFYPDGRDLGENYTYTLWRMSRCAQSGQLSCLHCHTSSGRYRHKDNPNQSCMPCHGDRVANATNHTRHQSGSLGNNCISCHMPMTEFARMRRSDHSMLPPTPAATIQFESPNACNICHEDKDAAWADGFVRTWRERDYQAPVLHRAGLIEAARRRDWKNLSEMLAYLEDDNKDEVYAASLVRLLRACEDPTKWPVIIKMTTDPSPLVRGAAAESLSLFPSKQTGRALIKAAGDEYRLVRIRAAGALAGYPKLLAEIVLDETDRENLKKATKEFIASHMSRPDNWTSHYNLGNYYLQSGDILTALAAYETALKLEPRATMALVNSSIAYARMGENSRAEESLKNALKVEPDNAAANFNMGLLLAEKGDITSAETYLRAALAADDTLHEAAYNLGILLTNDKPAESFELLRRAFELNPNPRYGYTLCVLLSSKW